MADSEILSPKLRPPILRTLLFKRPVRIFCGECSGYIPSTLPWICGHCSLENHQTRIYSFLYKCQRCKKRPSAIACPHCRTIWCFEKDGDPTHPARSIQLQIPPPIAEDENKKRIQAHQKKQEDTRFRIDETRLTLELKTLEEQLAAIAGDSHLTKLEKDFLRDQARFLGTKQLVAKWTKIYQELFHDDPKSLSDALTFLKCFEADHA